MTRFCQFCLYLNFAALVSMHGLAVAHPADGTRPNSGNRRAAKAETPESIPGYTIKKIEGFNVIINNDVFTQDISKYDRKPTQVLELELGTIADLLPPDAIGVLRRLLIWVEWDEKTVMSNGRTGSAAAVYYGGHQLALLQKGKHPLKAKSVTVLSMRSLTEEHQPSRDSGRCVLLHEMAHAVQNELLGRQSPAIQAAYYQAMQRNLYDKNLYAATNEQEFFAELTCAYFNQLHYYPRTRDDLEKHDPVTFRVMQEVWGKRPIAETRFAAEKKSAGSSSENPDAIDLAKLDLGKHLAGPAIASAQLKERPVLLLLWHAGNGSSLTGLSKLQAWDDELRNFGLVTIGEHLTGQEPIDIKKAAVERNIDFTITEGRWTDRSLVKNFTDFPLCIVFGHDGRSQFQGSPFEAEQAVRRAVGEALAASFLKEVGDDKEIPTSLANILEALREGVPPQSQLMKLSSLARIRSGNGGELAAALLARITAAGQKQLDAAEELAEKDPVAAFIRLERVAATYKGAPIGQEATRKMGKLRSLRAVQLEFKARQALVLVEKLDSELNSRPGSFDPTQEKFRMQNAALLGQLQRAIAQMAQTWPEAHATREAIAIGRKYRIAI